MLLTAVAGFCLRHLSLASQALVGRQGWLEGKSWILVLSEVKQHQRHSQTSSKWLRLFTEDGQGMCRSNGEPDLFTEKATDKVSCHSVDSMRVSSHIFSRHLF